MGRNIDKTYIQMRMLNTGKGPAVHALRAQADKFLYQHTMKETLEKQERLTLRQGMVEELIVEDGVCKGVITKTGARYLGKAVVLTTGTYLRGKIIMGELMYESGPNNQQPAVKLSESCANTDWSWSGLKPVRRRGCIRTPLIFQKPKFSRGMKNLNFSLMKRRKRFQINCRAG